MWQVMDRLVVALSKFTALLDASAAKPVLAFGENERARLAMQTLFTIANRNCPHQHLRQSFPKMNYDVVKVACLSS